MKIRTNEDSTCPVLLGQAIRNTSSAIVLSVMREVEIWRIAVPLQLVIREEAGKFVNATLDGSTGEYEHETRAGRRGTKQLY
jgi:hypothetical protein